MARNMEWRAARVHGAAAGSGGLRPAGAAKNGMSSWWMKRPGWWDGLHMIRPQTAGTCRGFTTDMYIELHARSAFSFLEGASLPQALMARAADLERPAIALLDRNGLCGGRRFHTAGHARAV